MTVRDYHYDGDRQTGKTERAVEAVALAMTTGKRPVLVTMNEHLARVIRERLQRRLYEIAPDMEVRQRVLQRIVVNQAYASRPGNMLHQFDEIHWDVS